MEEAWENLCPYLLNLVPEKVNEEMNSMLSTPVTINDIKHALDNMEPNKAPGLDRFTVYFIKT